MYKIFNAFNYLNKVSDGEGGILSLEHKLIEDSSSQSNLNERY